MATLEIHQFPCLSDNYGVLIHDGGSGLTASIDAPDADAVAAALKATGWKLSHILTTHHHADHTGGNLALKSQTGCSIIGPRGEAARVPGIDKPVGGGDAFAFGGLQVRVIDTPGHTAGHITYWIPDAKTAFVGDTLFAIGCGRVIEGDARMMWASLQKLMALPGETSIYCGHEYTQANAKFALTIEPENADLQKRAREVDHLRAAGKPTLPTSIAIELATNPFLRPHVAAIQKRLGMEGRPEWEIFGEIRERKNRF
ncbi:MAG: hydroxyacylglutathione hydrolase [Hyphomicrobiaceae bacterium]|nr:MAG: hydroxyacylglutathione hydrolase [Hyphomicrobiaceae bacterium]